MQFYYLCKIISSIVSVVPLFNPEDGGTTHWNCNCSGSNVIHHYAKIYIYSGIRSLVYASAPERPVHSNTNATSVGSIQPCCNYYMKAICFFGRCSFMKLSALRQCGVTEWPRLWSTAKGFEPSPLDWDSAVLTHVGENNETIPKA